jgi:hypothetical protein
MPSVAMPKGTPVTAVTVSGFGESQVGSPHDGQHETRSPESNPERPQPATGWSATGT